MDAVILQAIVDKDHRLIVDLPPDMPIGPVTVTIQPTGQSLSVEEARRRLAAAGYLSTSLYVSDDAEQISDEEMERLGRLFADKDQSFADLVDKDRGTRE